MDFNIKLTPREKFTLSLGFSYFIEANEDILKEELEKKLVDVLLIKQLKTLISEAKKVLEKIRQANIS
jgi:hypothetical protein